MAELLLLDIDHKWDSIPLNELVAVHGVDVEQIYNMRIQKDDIIEVQPSGFWSLRPDVINPKNKVVSIPFISFEQSMIYMSPEYDIDLNIIKKRRWNIDTINLIFNENRIAVIKNMGQLNSILRDKKNG